MAANLKNLRIKEISFVDKGASGDEEDRPSVAFWKRRKEKATMKLTKQVISKVYKAIELQKMEMPEGAQAILETIKDTLSPEQWAVVEMMLAQAKEMTPGSDKPASPEPPKPEEKATDDPEDPPAPKPEDEMMKLAKAHPELADVFNEAIEKMKAKTKEPEMSEDFAKKFPEEAKLIQSLQKRLDAEASEKAELQKSLKKAQEDIEKGQKEAATQFQKARIAKFENLAESEMAYLQGTPTDIAKRLCDVEDAMDPEAFEAHVTMLKAASAQIQKSGSMKPTGAPGSSDGSAWDAICKKAEELLKEKPELRTLAKARTQIIKTNTDLAKRYNQERHAAH